MQAPVMRSRPATEADRELCWRVVQQTMRPYIAATWGWDDADQRARFDAAFEPGDREIIELDGRPIGVLRVDSTGSPVRLLNIQLLPAFQRQGHGTAIIEAVVRRAPERPVWLQVLKANPARSLYERLGFRVIGHTDSHWQMLRRPSA